MPPIRSILIALVLTLVSLEAAAQRLRIATEPWSPYAFIENDQAKGIDYDVTVRVFERLGIEVQWVFMPWRRCLAMLDQGRIDGVLDIIHTEERAQWLQFSSEPLSTIEFVLFQDNDHPHPVDSLADLAGLTVGTSPAYTYGDDFTHSTHFRQETAPSHEANFSKMLRGRIDLVLTDRRVGAQVVRAKGLQRQVSQLPLVIFRRPQFLAVRRNAGMDALMQRFSVELQRFKQEPQYQQLLLHYAINEPTSAAPATAQMRPYQHTVEQHERGAM
jgi:polar amino acid transport system substrate-binding protein